MTLLKNLLNRLPLRRKPRPFTTSLAYWQERYEQGKDSGVGSQGKFAQFKAAVVNSFVQNHEIASVIEFGCGEGSQLKWGQYPEYLGLEVSRRALDACRALFKDDTSKRFKLMSEYRGETAELALSLDVLYHLIEDEVYEQYMQRLFSAAEKYVIIYSSNRSDSDPGQHAHVRHRAFTGWVEQNRPDWTLTRRLPNRYEYKGDITQGSFSDFYIYAKTA